MTFHGYRPDFSWIDFDATDASGWLANDRGVCTAAPGLYCVGQPFQFGLTSALVGGVGRDAAFVAARIRDAAPGPVTRAARTGEGSLLRRGAGAGRLA